MQSNFTPNFGLESSGSFGNFKPDVGKDVPANALLAADGTPILTADGNYILL